MPNLKKDDLLERSIECYKNALTIYNSQSYPRETAETYTKLGLAYLQAGQLDDAHNAFLESTQIFTRFNYCRVWNNHQIYIALAYLETNNNSICLERAISCFYSCIHLSSLLNLPNTYIKALFYLGLSYKKSGKSHLALQVFEQTIDKIENYKNNITSTEEGTEKLIAQYSNSKNRNTASKQFISATNGKISSIDFMANTFKMIDTVEFLQVEVDTESQDLYPLTDRKYEVYQNIIELCIELGEYTKAIEYVDRSKARNLVELIAIRGAYPEGDIPGAVRQRLQELRNLISEEDRRLQQDPQPDYQYISQLRQEYQDKFPYKPVPFDEMQKLLDEKTAILEWYILPGEKLLTFIITANDLKLQVFAKEDLDQLVDLGNEYLNAYFDERDHHHIKWATDLPATMQKLSNILHLPQLLESVFEELPQCEKLILMPHLFLHLFPIHALPVMHKGENKPLQEYFAQGVSYAPNCQLLQQVQKRQYSGFDRLFAIQNPTKDLKFTDMEVEAITTLFKKLAEPTVLKYEQAEKSSITESEIFPDSHCIHFSCHGYFNFADALKSALILAKSIFPPPPPEDDSSRYLPLKDNQILDLEKCLILENILQLNLKNCRLVTLSACETAVTDFQSTSDEYISLTSGFILAGVTNVVSTLWAVSDISAAILMIHFYETLLADKQKLVAVALQASQKWLREATTQDLLNWADQCTFISQERRQEIKQRLTFGAWKNKLNDKRFNSPYHWAAFCAIGQ